MKRIMILAFFMAAILSGGAYALDLPKIGYVDVEEVYKVYPGAEDIRLKLKNQKDQFQAEIDKYKEEIARMELEYQSSYDRLKDEERQRREAEIDYKKQLLTEYIEDSNKKLAALRDELTKPVYLKIAAIIQRVSEEKGFTFVLRKGSDSLLYVDKRYDLTRDVITRLKKELQLEDR